MGILKQLSFVRTLFVLIINNSRLTFVFKRHKIYKIRAREFIKVTMVSIISKNAYE